MEPLHFVNFTQLRSFYAVACTLNVTKAAKLLHVSQPTVTTQVKALEHTFDVQLFERTAQRTELTPIGEELFEIATQIFSLANRAYTLLDSDDPPTSTRLRIGSVGPFFVMRLLSRFNKEHPEIPITLESGNSDEIYRKLLDYKIDIGVTGAKVDNPSLLQSRLGVHEIVIIVNSDHPWMARKAVTLADLGGARVILREKGSMTRYKFERLMQVYGIRVDVVMELTRDALCEAVRAGFGAGIISRAELPHDNMLHTLSIAGEKLSTESYVACRSDCAQMRSVELFMNVVKSWGTRKD